MDKDALIKKMKDLWSSVKDKCTNISPEKKQHLKKMKDDLSKASIDWLKKAWSFLGNLTKEVWKWTIDTITGKKPS